MRNGLRFGFAVLALALGCDDTTDHPEGLDAQVPVDMTLPNTDRGAEASAQPEVTPADAMTVDDTPADDGTCGAGRVRCPDQTECVSLRTDPRHCGACGRSCALAHVSLDAARCDMGRCVIASACEPGWGDCNGVESDGCETALVDATNCGACGNRCSGPTPMCRAAGAAGDGGVGDAGLDAAADGSVSAGYACASGCTATERRCGTTCVDVTSDALHCGACGHPCAGAANAAPACRMGACAVQCADGWADCDHDPANGCEVQLASDRAHCGACDTACADVGGAPGVCVGGRCALTCGATVGNCDGDLTNGCETNLLTDARHCGACGAACPTRASSTAVCRAGLCAITCPAGRADCDALASNECEVDTRTDPLHCGGCATACPPAAHATATCASGACGVACQAGYGDCDATSSNGCEVDTRVDVLHCGGCGRPCAVPANGRATCAAGSCGFTCDEGYTAVGTRCSPNPPQQLWPRATTMLTGRRPTFRWGPSSYEAVRLYVCRDRECATELTHVDVARVGGVAPTSAAMTDDLPQNTVLYWRVRGLASGAPVTGFSPSWPFRVRARGGSLDVAWGSYFDVNGDGRADIALGSLGQAVLVYHGLATGVASSATVTVRAPTGVTGFGFAVANAGDVNGDGYSDLVVGARNTSQAFVFHGGPSGLSTTPDAVIEGTAGRFLGTSVAGVGDVDHDGFADIAVGVPGPTATPIGAVYIYRGSARGTVVGAPSQVIVQPTGAQTFAYDLAAAGDVNGDGYEDMLVGAGQNTAMTSGASNQAFLYLGGAAAMASTPAATWSTGVGTAFGHPVAGAGDLNGDGYADVAIGATDAGYVNLYYGGAMGPPAVESLRLLDGARDFGRSVASAGDLNRDGFDDLLVGTNYGGRAYVFTGAAGGPSTSAAVTLRFSTSSSGGYTVASPGDINGDGYSDALIGARDLGAGYYFAGSSSVLFSGPTVTLMGGGVADLSIAIVGM